MKNITDFINENLLVEASKYKPKFKPADWAKALQELKKGSYSNYSQLRGMESSLRDDYYSTADEWVEEIYDSDFDPKHVFKDVITDIANFFIDNWEYSGFDYADEQEEIYNCKSTMTDCDFGVEEENWYKFYEYTGPSSMKKYAKEIAKVGDCSYMDNI